MIDRHIEATIMPTCHRQGMGLVVWSPLAQGILTGKYNEGTRPKDSRADTTQFLDSELNEANLAKARKLTKMAGDMGIKLSQMALAWVLRRPEISCAIIGATTVAQLDENVIATEVRLSDSDLEAIENVLTS
jgi:aryl-alcohol dehydrogenase-like predicted oxidoreductase